MASVELLSWSPAWISVALCRLSGSGLAGERSKDRLLRGADIAARAQASSMMLLDHCFQLRAHDRHRLLERNGQENIVAVVYNVDTALEVKVASREFVHKDRSYSSQRRVRAASISGNSCPSSSGSDQYHYAD